MERHPFDPISALAGLLLAVLGVVVGSFGIDTVADNAVAWASAAAAVVGVALAWPRRNRQT